MGQGACDHWGYQSYKAKTNCLTCGQVLGCDYSFEDGELIVKEMMDLLCLEMVKEPGFQFRDPVCGIFQPCRSKSRPGNRLLDAQTNADIVLIPAVLLCNI